MPYYAAVGATFITWVLMQYRPQTSIKVTSNPPPSPPLFLPRTVQFHVLARFLFLVPPSPLLHKWLLSSLNDMNGPHSFVHSLFAVDVQVWAYEQVQLRKP